MAEHRAPVIIAVPTFRRPQKLAALLPLLVEQARELDAAGATRTAIVVVDNDPDGSARDEVEAAAAVAAAASEPVTIRYTHETQPGIAAARNRALDEAADARLLAFIDDDERPRPGWLRELVRVQRDTGAALVQGWVDPEYEVPPSSWILAGRFFVRRTWPTGTALGVSASNNVLLDVEQVRESGLRFALDLGLSGGEDTLFTSQLAARGYRLVWCAESVVTDLVPASRITRRWVLRRALSHGNSAAVVRIRLAGGPLQAAAARAEAAVGGAVRVAGGVARCTLGVVTRSEVHQARGSRAAYRGVGMIVAAVGGVVQEYARPATAEGLASAPKSAL
ncbi:glycosyltransferase [Leifsonia shinshuensis]|uniref:glycosyltransferase family 2 protein n=1 Tax=Leifsonia shinshuensis TaxID=150026 RepID=UPI001F5049DD|nr:glycosyltransferase [Leifsonia shinshuensis]MCI0159341.1 glycosyltransferase [Leifsonia shinshuensis]